MRKPTEQEIRDMALQDILVALWACIPQDTAALAIRGVLQPPASGDVMQDRVKLMVQTEVRRLLPPHLVTAAEQPPWPATPPSQG